MVECKKKYIPEDVCYIAFSESRWNTEQEEIGVTVRGEDVIVDRAPNGEIVGFELVGPNKPCQRGYPDEDSHKKSG